MTNIYPRYGVENNNIYWHILKAGESLSFGFQKLVTESANGATHLRQSFLTLKASILVGKTKAYVLTVEISENRTYPTECIQARVPNYICVLVW